MVHVECYSLWVHLVAFQTERLPLVRLRERTHWNVLDAHAVHDGDFLEVGAAGRDVRFLERPLRSNLHRERGMCRKRNLRFGVRHVEHEFTHRETRRNPRAAGRGVARAVVEADFDAALLGLFAREADVLPPFWREGHEFAGWIVQYLGRPWRTHVGHAENGRRADSDFLEPVEILDDAFTADVVAHPVPPHAGLRALWWIAEYDLWIGRGLRKTHGRLARRSKLNLVERAVHAARNRLASVAAAALETVRHERLAADDAAASASRNAERARLFRGEVVERGVARAVFHVRRKCVGGQFRYRYGRSADVFFPETHRLAERSKVALERGDVYSLFVDRLEVADV